MSAMLVWLVAGALFVGGVVTGMLVMVSRAIRREDQRYSLRYPAPGRVARGARLVMGVWVTRW